MTTSNPLDRFERELGRLINNIVPELAYPGADVTQVREKYEAALEAAAVELVNNELTDFWTSLTPDENIMRAAENYQKFCDRIDALGDSHDHQ